MQRSKAVKGTLFTIWLLLIAAVIWALANQQRFFATAIKPIATLNEKSGNVTSRSEDLIRWLETEMRHAFFDGDRVATGRASSAKIAFDPGRSIAMGADAQIQITKIEQGNGENAFLITLVRGGVVADVLGACKGCPPLIIRAGRETFNVVSGQKVGLFKEVGKKVRTFDPQLPIPSAAPRKPVTLVSAATIAPTAVPTSMPIAVATPKVTPMPSQPPALNIEQPKGFEAELNASSLGPSPASPRVWWTLRPLSGLGQAVIEMAIIKPHELPKVGKWKPLFQMTGADGVTGKIDLAVPGLQQDMLLVPIEKIRRVATMHRVGAASEYDFKIRGGAIVAGSGTAEVHSISAKAVDLKIRSFGEAPAGPLALALDKMKADQSTGIWFAPKSELSIDAAPVAIFLESAGDLPKFHPYMKGSGALGLRGGAPFTESGLFVVRNQKIVAQLFGSGVGEDVVGKVMSALGADFVFKGRRKALNDTRGKTQTDLVQWIGALLDKGNSLYILKRNKLYPVNRDFIKTNSEVAQFIDSQAKAIFLEKVEILDFR